MPTVDQADSGAPSQLSSALVQAETQLSAIQTVVFTKYIRLVLPLDGYVFWVKADLVSPSALFNAAAFNDAVFNGEPLVTTPAPTLLVQGSLHNAIEQRQSEDQSLAVNRVVFTTPTKIQDFDAISPTVMYLATVGEFRFAFSSRKNFYQQAGIFHYMGDAVYPVMETQIIDNKSQFDSRRIVVSDSLPVWLAMPSYVSPYDNGIYPPDYPLYPSFLLPDNLRPPYASVHIPPEETRAIAAAPYLGRRLSHHQLAHDRVKLTFFGLRNDQAQMFHDFLNQYSVDTNVIGIMNMPIMRDEKQVQTELGVIAQKKTFDVEISYYQSTMRDVARQLIESVIVDYQPQEFVAVSVNEGAL